MDDKTQALRKLIAEAPVALLMVNRKLIQIEASRGWLQERRQSRDDVIGLHLYDTFAGLPEHWKSSHQRALAGEFVSAEAELYVAPDGREIWITWSVWPWGDQGEDTGGIILYASNVTKHVLAEKAAQQSEVRYRALFQNMNESFAYCRLVYDGDGPEDFIYLAVNEAFERMSGNKAVVGRRSKEVFPNGRGKDPKLFETYCRVATTGVPEKLELLVKSLNAWHSVSVYSPERDHFVAMFDDITERKKAEQAQRESEAQFRVLADAIPQLCWMADADGSIFWYNQRWYEYTGTTPEDMKGWGWQKAHDPDRLPGIMTQWKTSLDAGTPVDMVFPLRGADGLFRTFLTRVVPLRDEAGIVSRWFGTNTDISEQVATAEALRQSEQRLQQLNSELEQRVRERTAQLEASNRELETFAYSVSHDLRAPLRGIDGWSEALIEDFGGQLPELAQTYLQRVRHEAQRMGMLIDDLLRLSRVTRAPIVLERVDLKALALGISERLRDRHRERRIDFDIADGLEAEGDAKLLEVALTNLFDNAVKFTRPRDVARIEFGEFAKDGEAVFFVRDNGVGFDMAYASTLFGAFQRLHKFSEFPGTGIGLATVQRVIHRHGGRIWAEAELDRGASFYFTIGSAK